MKIEIEKTCDGYIINYVVPSQSTPLGCFPPYSKKRLAPSFDILIDLLAEITSSCVVTPDRIIQHGTFVDVQDGEEVQNAR